MCCFISLLFDRTALHFICLFVCFLFFLRWNNSTHIFKYESAVVNVNQIKSALSGLTDNGNNSMKPETVKFVIKVLMLQMKPLHTGKKCVFCSEKKRKKRETRIRLKD